MCPGHISPTHPSVASAWAVSPSPPAAMTNGANNAHLFLTVWGLQVAEVRAELVVGAALSLSGRGRPSLPARGDRERALSPLLMGTDVPMSVLPSGPHVSLITSVRLCLQIQSCWERSSQPVNPRGHKQPVHSFPLRPLKFMTFLQTHSLQPNGPKPEPHPASNCEVLGEHRLSRPWVTLGRFILRPPPLQR